MRSVVVDEGVWYGGGSQQREKLSISPWLHWRRVGLRVPGSQVRVALPPPPPTLVFVGQVISTLRNQGNLQSHHFFPFSKRRDTKSEETISKRTHTHTHKITHARSHPCTLSYNSLSSGETIVNFAQVIFRVKLIYTVRRFFCLVHVTNMPKHYTELIKAKLPKIIQREYRIFVKLCNTMRARAC